MTDFTVSDQDTLWIFEATTPDAQELVLHLDLAVWQYLGRYRFAMDHQPAKHLVGQLRIEGFTVGGDAAEVQDVKSCGETTRLLVEQGNKPWVTG